MQYDDTDRERNFEPIAPDDEEEWGICPTCSNATDRQDPQAPWLHAATGRVECGG